MRASGIGNLWGESQAMTAREAVEFFATKIEEQAKRENVLMTGPKRMLLRFSEVEPDGINNPELASLLGEDDKEDEFDDLMGNLLLRSYEREQGSPELLQKWNAARDGLRNHEYYIWTMVWYVFPETMPDVKLGKPSSVTDYLLYVAIGLAVVAIAIYFGFNSR